MIGERLAGFLKRKKKSASAFAKAIGVNRTVIAKLLSGTRTSVRPDTALKIHLGTGGEISINELLFGEVLAAPNAEPKPSTKRASTRSAR